MAHDSDDNNSDNEEEVTTVLRHFQPRPDLFVGNNSSSSSSGWVDQPNRPSRSRGGGRARRDRRDRGYSSIRYLRHDRKLRLSYLYLDLDGPRCCLFLTLDVSTVHPRSVVYVHCNGGGPGLRCSTNKLRQAVDDLCRRVAPAPAVVANDSVSASTRPDHNNATTLSKKTRTRDCHNASLFSVVSRLLQSLNHDLPALVSNSTDANVNTTVDIDAVLRKEMASSCHNNNNHSPPAVVAGRILDLELLLLRSAAAGRNRATVCSPVPAEYYDAAMTIKHGNVEVVANGILATTDRMRRRTPLLVGVPPPQCLEPSSPVSTNAPVVPVAEQQQQFREQVLLAFLLSLPWTKGGLEVVATVPAATTKTSTIADDNRHRNESPLPSTTTLRLCLDITAARGDASPRWARLAQQRGVVTAYHGTKIENAWSILNYGLQNLSYHKTVSRNGAMMGTGVYLSTSYDVAAFFAQTGARYTPALWQAWQHPSLARLIQEHAGGADAATRRTIQWDEYTVRCFPVFEATILAPPVEGGGDDGPGNNNNNNNCTRREGNYFVVPNSDDIRITKLHLTLELKKKRPAATWWWPLVCSMIVVCVAFWML